MTTLSKVAVLYDEASLLETARPTYAAPVIRIVSDIVEDERHV
jgi:hypothetical protein